MRKINNKKGITMISLVITIVVLLILSGIGIGMGSSAIKTSQDSKLTSELMIVQHAVLEQYTKYKTTKDSSYLIGNKIEISKVQTIADEIGIELVNIPSSESNKEYYQLDKAALLDMGIENSEDEYIINYISGEVINITKKETSNHQPLYVKANSFYNQ